MTSYVVGFDCEAGFDASWYSMLFFFFPINAICIPSKKKREKCSLATFVLDGEVERWWRGQHQDKFGGVPSI
ncbi:hypothetical protein IEQ34_021516 [Dendrobium chrysotoxum]|uniref:Uncharacterized protein n=1 Tax=Dendrobium chrysotoxum TaxID=161865 RepID=A0AAV7FML3_DENCH|nr:hypothetical protein IEQ34_021516 [Dendrobium chrysotoxum]